MNSTGTVCEHGNELGNCWECHRALLKHFPVPKTRLAPGQALLAYQRKLATRLARGVVR